MHQTNQHHLNRLIQQHYPCSKPITDLPSRDGNLKCNQSSALVSTHPASHEPVPPSIPAPTMQGNQSRPQHPNKIHSLHCRQLGVSGQMYTYGGKRLDYCLIACDPVHLVSDTGGFSFPRVALPRGGGRGPLPAPLNPDHRSSRGRPPPSPSVAAANVHSRYSSPLSFPSPFPSSEPHHHGVAPLSATAVVSTGLSLLPGLRRYASGAGGVPTLPPCAPRPLLSGCSPLSTLDLDLGLTPSSCLPASIGGALLRYRCREAALPRHVSRGPWW
jgi:hypothetical protein